MTKLSNSLKWYIMFILVTIVNIITYVTGLYDTIWAADVTKLSFVILSLFLLSSLKCGWNIYNLEKSLVLHKREIEFGWFMSETLLAIGMTGTVIGFIIIMKDFIKLDINDLSTVESMIKNLGAGISTALYTTLFGLISSILLKVQYFLLEDTFEKINE